MPVDGSGNFTRSYNFVNDKNAGTKIVASRVDGEFDNFASAINLMLLRNGAVPLTGSLNMNTNSITALGSGTVGAPSIRFNADATTGIYMPAAAQVALVTGGVERLQASNTGILIPNQLTVNGVATFGGNVTFGAGVTAGNIAGVGGAFTGNVSAGGTLAVTGASTFGSTGVFSGAVTAPSYVSTVTNGNAIVLGTNSTIRDNTNGASTLSLGVSGGGATHGAFALVSSNANTVRAYIDTVGNFGINAVPLSTFDINGTSSRHRADLSGVLTTWTTTNSAASVYRAIKHDALAHRWSLSGTDTVYLTSAGNLLIGGSIDKNRLSVAAAGTANAPTLGTATGIAYFSNNDQAYGLLIGNSSADGHAWLQAARTDAVATAYALTLNEGGGNVGVNTNQPTAPLDVVGTSATDIFRTRNGTTYLSIGVTNGSKVEINAFQTAVGVRDLILQSSGGNVGIGVTPTQRFHVNGNMLASGYYALAGGGIYFNGGGSAATGIGSDGTGAVLNLYTGGVPQMALDATGGLTSANLANAVGFKGVPQNAQAGAYTLVMSDQGKHIYCTGGAAAVTIPPNATVAFPIGAAITVLNDGAGARTITQGAGVTLKWAGTGTAGDRTLAVGGMATLLKVAADTWYVSGSGLS